MKCAVTKARPECMNEKVSILDALKLGIQAHRAGDVQKAERYYRAILNVKPNHADANHNMGVLAIGIGKTLDALPFFKMALEANPDVEQFWLSYIDALIKLEKVDDAKALLSKAKEQGLEQEKLDLLEKSFFSFSSVRSNVQKITEPSEYHIKPIVALHNEGKFLDALDKEMLLLEQFPNSALLQNMIGATKIGLKKYNEAIEAYRKAISIKPDCASFYNDLGNALQEQGNYADALKEYNKAIELKPDYAVAYNNMGNVFNKDDNFDAAVKAYKKAIKFNPNFSQAFNNLGVALKNQGNFDASVEALREAINISPNYAEPFNNMGNTLKEQNKANQAIEAYEKAISIDPNYADAYNNIGTTFYEKNMVNEAIDFYIKAIKIREDYVQAYYNLSASLEIALFEERNTSLHKIIINLLDLKAFVRPARLVRSVISLLKTEPAIKGLLKKQATGTLQYEYENTILALYDLPLFFKFMSIVPIADLEFEGVLKNLRSYILKSLVEAKELPDLIYFQSALALQCFTNEYLYNESSTERANREQLQIIVERCLESGIQPSPQVVLCLASYKSLIDYKWYDFLEVNEDIEEVFSRQVLEPKQEADLKIKIPVLEEVINKVSLKVKDQYERNPYPRWINLALPKKPRSISEFVSKLNLRLYDESIKRVTNPEILVAGCGTGQHSIGTASNFKDCSVLAVDLSLSSLAYAKRKTDELGVANIQYMKADILSLSKLERQFDLIESVGVLHHMEDPLVGWEMLVKSLRVGGLMKIGLYSSLARKDINWIRKEIKKSKIDSDVKSIRAFRHKLLNSNNDNNKSFVNLQDFYCLSEVRDLLFHVQEHGFNLLQIDKCLSNLNLKFCGFGSQGKIKNFSKMYNKESDIYNLKKWNEYETSFPLTFLDMYQFWCQKIS